MVVHNFSNLKYRLKTEKHENRPTLINTDPIQEILGIAYTELKLPRGQDQILVRREVLITRIFRGETMWPLHSAPYFLLESSFRKM